MKLLLQSTEAPNSFKSLIAFPGKWLVHSSGFENFFISFTSAGIHERGNYLAAAGFGSKEGNLGIFATFSALNI